MTARRRVRGGVARLAAALGLGALSLVAVPLVPVAPAAAASDLNGWKATWGTGFTIIPDGCGTLVGSVRFGAGWNPGDVTTVGGSLVLDVRPGAFRNPSTFGAVGCPGQARQYGRYEVVLRTALPNGVTPYFMLWPATSVTDSYAAHGSGSLPVNPPATAGPVWLGLPPSGPSQSYVIEWTPGTLRLVVGGRTTTFATPGGRRFPVIAVGPASLTGFGPVRPAGTGTATVGSLQTWAWSPSTVVRPPTSSPAVSTASPTPTPSTTATTPRASVPSTPPSTGATPTPSTGTTAPATTPAGPSSPASGPPASASGPTPTSAVGSGARAALALGLVLSAGAGILVGRRLVLARLARSAPGSPGTGRDGAGGSSGSGPVPAGT